MKHDILYKLTTFKILCDIQIIFTISISICVRSSVKETAIPSFITPRVYVFLSI